MDNYEKLEADYKRIKDQNLAEQTGKAVENAKQEMFEACVRASCAWCNNASRTTPVIPVFVRTRPDREDLADLGTYYHQRENSTSSYCNASGMRLAFPERSEKMNALTRYK